MTDDQIYRGIALGVFGGLIAVFRPQIARFMHKIGYRDWRNPDPPDKKDTPDKPA